MASFNQVILVGRLGTDAEIREVGKSTVAKVRLATNYRYKDKDGNWTDGTDWHTVNIWNPSEALQKYLKKGAQIMVTGELRERSYDDKDGNRRYVTEVSVTARNVVLLGSGNGKGKTDIAEPDEVEEPVDSSVEDDDDGVPF